MEVRYTSTKKWYRKAFLKNLLVPFFLSFNKDKICVYILFIGVCEIPGPDTKRGQLIIRRFRKTTLIFLSEYETNAIYVSRILRNKAFF